MSANKTVRLSALALSGALLAAAGVVTSAGQDSSASATDFVSSSAPDFGPNVLFMSPEMPVADVNATLASISEETEFSAERHAVFFKPGTYGSSAGQDNPLSATGIVNANVGYYTTIAGLGATPGDVHINGSLHVEPVQGSATEPWNAPAPGSLNHFWRSMSNLQINPIQRPIGDDAARAFPEGVVEQPHAFRWAVSQAAPMRRMDIQGSVTMFGRFGAFASGGYLANSQVAGTVYSGSQQQYYTRDSNIGAWDGGVWNMVFSGTPGAPADSWPSPRSIERPVVVPNTVLPATHVSREAPFLKINSAGEFSVFAPHARLNAHGVSWETGATDGRDIPINEFFIAKPADSIETINTALAQGKNLLLTPGVYNYGSAIQITNPNTVVLGIGMASLVPTNGNSVVKISDVAGVQLSGITIDAGLTKSDKLLQVGPASATVSDSVNPTTLTDVFVRIGGVHAGKATTSIEVNSDHTLMDNIWAWRGDHGNGIGWDQNTADHGVIVNGDDVTALGLFVEHYQKTQTIWNGERGRTIFYQSEIPYDPPTPAAWTDGTGNGYPSYLVAEHVNEHHTTGMGVYSFFLNNGPILDTAIQVPEKSGITLERIVTRFLNGYGQISHPVNNIGEPATSTPGQETYWLKTNHKNINATQ